jgi:hypothetical protein
MTPEGAKYLRQEIKKRTEEVPERKISESTNCVERKSTNHTTYDEYSKQSEADLELLKNIKTGQNNCTADYSQKQDHFHNELVEIFTNVSQKQNEFNNELMEMITNLSQKQNESMEMITDLSQKQNEFVEMITNLSQCANEMKPLILNKLENENTLY